MRLAALLPLLAAGHALAETTEKETATNTLLTLTGSIATTTINDATVPTGDYLTYSSTIYLTTHGTALGSTVVSGNDTSTGNATTAQNATMTTTSESVTVLVGGQTTLSGNGTANVTSTAPPASTSTAVNTQPCNGYPEFCNRKYSNITMVAAHNSPFVMKGNAAANQELDVTYQWRMEFECVCSKHAHLVNGTVYLCHTTCDLLNAGTLEAYLTTVAGWMRQHPYDVVTILIGNYDYVNPGNFTAPIENSGLMDLVWTPPMIPMGLEDWPTLGNMIISGKRVLVFMDYQANQTAIPWLMDEFSQMWETPFSPTDRNFPCTEQRPPNLSEKDAKERMYMANHNLNLQIDIANINLLIPNTALLNETNADTGYGSLGWMADNCT
ncbi:hypothetical protein ARAM_006717, partial [Aspergillus rambellii]